MDIEESGHTDVASAKNQVKIAMSALEKMRAELTKLDDEGSLPSWWTNKVAIAVDKLDGMADYLDTQVEENEMENENELDEDAKMGKQSDDNLKSMMKKFRDMEKKNPKEPSTKFMIKRIGKEMKKRGLKEMNEDNELIQRVSNAISFYEAKSSTGYELYHKDFSSAMQHAYAFAKKKYGITIDPKEIDDKVATGPKKPSKDKTNKYRLKGDKGTVQIQVANLDNKRFELNMYKEELDAEDEPKVKEVIKKLKGASKAHAGQASDLEKAVKEELKLDEASMTYRIRKAQKSEIDKMIKSAGMMKLQIQSSIGDIIKMQKDGDVEITVSGRAKNLKNFDDIVRGKSSYGDPSLLKKEEVELDEAKYEYDGKVVKISKKEFRKVHKDYKNSTKGKERMMILDPKTQGSISVPVQFEEVELDENAAVKALKNQADVSNPDDKKFFQKAAELLKKKDFVALGQHLYDYDTAPSEFAMSAIRDKDKASFKKMYGDQKGYFRTMKPKGLKEKVDENVQSVANAISFHEAKRMSPAAKARRDALRDIGGRKKDDEDEVKATDADREKADRNIINKLKKAADVKGNYEIKFDKGPSKKIPFKLLTLVLKKLDRMKPADKLKFQKQAEKSYADFLKAVKDIAR